VEKGDSLWSLAKQFNGCAATWPAIRYSNGQTPNEYKLEVGRTVIIPSKKSSTESAEPVQIATQKAPVKEVSQRATISLSFNKSMYCCAPDTVVMNAIGGFEVVPERHPFYVQEKRDEKARMAKFMNIRISEELLNAIE
tara:strand:+ start:12878 stop:13294 length:417 start_codon:yes stop_codon:yes gene_type:complete